MNAGVQEEYGSWGTTPNINISAFGSQYAMAITHLSANFPRTPFLWGKKVGNDHRRT